MPNDCVSQEKLNNIFPPDLTNKFFDAIYGDIDEGAYDIVLTCRKVEDNKANFAFELRKRAGKCLKCSLTYGLPEVFKRHPLLNIQKLAEELGKALEWNNIKWELFPVEEISDDLHIIPFEIYKS